MNIVDKSRQSVSIIAVLLVAMLQASLLCANDDSSNNKSATILELHAKGVDLYEQQKYAEAALIYREMLTVNHDYQYYYYVGECEYMRKRYDLAIEAFRIFLDNTADEVPAEARAHAEEAVREAEAIVGYVFPQGNNSIEVSVDNEHRGTAPLKKAIAVLPGKHVVSFMKNGETVYESVTHVGRRETVRVKQPEPELKESSGTEQPAIGPEQQAQEEMPEDPHKNVQDDNSEKATTAPMLPKHSPLKIVGIVTAGIGGATVVAGLVTGKLAVSKADQLAENCPDKLACDKGNDSLYSDGKSLKAATNVFWTTGAILIVGGAILTVAGYRKEKFETLTGIKSMPVVGSQMAGVIVYGSF